MFFSSVADFLALQRSVYPRKIDIYAVFIFFGAKVIEDLDVDSCDGGGSMMAELSSKPLKPISD